VSSAEHAYLPPSSAHIWVKCGAWADANQRNPHNLGVSSDASEEGTAAHWALAEVLQGRQVAVGLAAPNGCPLDAEMVESAEWAAGEVRKLCPDVQPLLIEQTLSAGKTLGPLVWGTPDVQQRSVDLTIRIVDYKYGHGHVDHVDNWQMITYATLVLDDMAERAGMGRGGLDEAFRFELSVVQPRCYTVAPVRTWGVGGAELRGYINKLQAAAEATVPGLSGEAVTGEHCRQCLGRLECQAFARAVGNALDVASTQLPNDLPVPAKAVQLVMLRRAGALIKAAEAGLETHLLALAQLGADVPGFAVKHSSGRQRWTLPDADVVAVGNLLGLDLGKVTAITPAQAGKAGMPVQMIDQYTQRAAGAASLQPIDLRHVAAIFKE
jgi:hypothetical protein